jgi:hypothetical protein
MLDELAHHRYEVTFVEDDDVGETLSPERPYHPLGNGVGLGCPKRREDCLNADVPGASDEVLPEASVSISYQELGLNAPGRGLDHLAPRPVGGGMSCHVEVHDRSATVINKEEDIQVLEGRGVDGEEVARPYVGSVIGEKGSPGLRWRVSPSLEPIAPHGLGAKLESQREKLTADPTGAPAWILLCDAHNQIAQLGRDTRPPPRAVATLECPVAFPSEAMPANDRVWLDDNQGISPTWPEPREKDPDEPVSLCETRSGFPTLVDGELVPQGGDL